MRAKAEPTLEELAAEVERLEQALWEAKQALWEAQEAVVEAYEALGHARRRLYEVRLASCPFQVGDVALSLAGESVIVRRVVPRLVGPEVEPGYYVSHRRKNGEWSKSKVYVSHLLQPVEPAENEA